MEIAQARPGDAGRGAANVIVIGTLPEAKLKAFAASMEKQYATAVKVPGSPSRAATSLVSGKVAVYVFNERGDYRSFVRSAVAKGSPGRRRTGPAIDQGRSAVRRGRAGTNQGCCPTPEPQAGQELAIALLAARSRNSPVAGMGVGRLRQGDRDAVRPAAAAASARRWPAS